ncbi:MAG TPA: hypothetical protein VM286_00190 [Candidatus Thermoplasmatota archaeon]|nr:hypothetical protein [Candidatus Thermoplasmatota archaeon]
MRDDDARVGWASFVCLFLFFSGCAQNVGHDASPSPASVGFKDFYWETKEPLGLVAFHIHVDVPNGATCRAEFKTSQVVAKGYGPTALHMLRAGQGNTSLGWYGRGQLLRFHAGDVDTRRMGVVPEYEGTMAWTRSPMERITQDFDAYAIANLTPIPDPHREDYDWFDRAVVFEYHCDQPAFPTIGLGDQPFMMDPSNMQGGMEVGGIVYQNKFHAEIGSPNVTVMAFMERGSGTVLDVQAPRAKYGWSEPYQAVPTGPLLRTYIAEDGVGTYDVTWDNLYPQSGGGDLVAILPTSAMSPLTPETGLP